MFGISLETFVKKWQDLVIYIVSGLLGNLGYLLIMLRFDCASGVSSAIFGW